MVPIAWYYFVLLPHCLTLLCCITYSWTLLCFIIKPFEIALLCGTYCLTLLLLLPHCLTLLCFGTYCLALLCFITTFHDTALHGRYYLTLLCFITILLEIALLWYILLDTALIYYHTTWHCFAVVFFAWHCFFFFIITPWNCFAVVLIAWYCFALLPHPLKLLCYIVHCLLLKYALLEIPVIYVCLKFPGCIAWNCFVVVLHHCDNCFNYMLYYCIAWNCFAWNCFLIFLHYLTLLCCVTTTALKTFSQPQ